MRYCVSRASRTRERVGSESCRIKDLSDSATRTDPREGIILFVEFTSLHLCKDVLGSFVGRKCTRYKGYRHAYVLVYLIVK